MSSLSFVMSLFRICVYERERENTYYVRQDLAVKETFGSSISLSDQPVYRSGIGKYIRQVRSITRIARGGRG
jgi:hypothetical protein